jgi:lysyl-tRNA synthetase class 1
MQWLNNLVDDIDKKIPKGEILIESGGSPSGAYHLGHMRELTTCDAILLELQRRGRKAKHIYFVDDLDVFRKVPSNVPEDFDQYLGMPLCDVPSPDGNEDLSYADFFLQGLIDSCKALEIDVEFVRSHPKYRSGWFVPAIEKSLEHMTEIKNALETISNRKLDPSWSPIQVIENGRLKNRKFISIDTKTKTVCYESADGKNKTAQYDIGEVKLDWRIDWPARWWMLHVDVEPFGREHASAGGSYDTGVQIMKDVFKAEAPIPVGYDSINMVGDTKKMSASKGTAISAIEAAQIMPAEVIRYFILRSPFNKLLFFDPVDGLIKLMDEYAALLATEEKSASEAQLLYICTRGASSRSVSPIPFSHLVASYQSSLKDPNKTIEVIKRTEHSKTATADAEIIRTELGYIEEWLKLRAPEDVKFSLLQELDYSEFSDDEKKFLKDLSEKIALAPDDADGEWFHKTIYEFKESTVFKPQQLFSVLYRVLIGKNSGPRAGWFLSILPREWLIKRLRLEA